VKSRRDLALLVGGSGVSMFGSALTLIVVLFTLRHHGPFAIAAALVALELPVVLGSPLVGWLVDSWPNRRLMVVALAVQAATSAGLAFLLGNVAAAVLLLFLLGTGTALTAPAASALIPQVTGEDAATRGYALFATVRVAATLVGSTAGGVLVAGPGQRVALLIDAGTFAVQAGLLLLVHTERDPAAIRRRQTHRAATLWPAWGICTDSASCCSPSWDLVSW